MREVWEVVQNKTVTPDDIRTGKVEAGPLHGAQTVRCSVFTVPAKRVVVIALFVSMKK